MEEYNVDMKELCKQFIQMAGKYADEKLSGPNNMDDDAVAFRMFKEADKVLEESNQLVLECLLAARDKLKATTMIAETKRKQVNLNVECAEELVKIIEGENKDDKRNTSR